MKAIYFRCSSGHYFASVHCPFDGWTSPGAAAVASAAAQISTAGLTASIEELARHGVGQPAIARCIVIEFGNANSSFDAMLIGEYVAGDLRVDRDHFGPEYS